MARALAIDSIDDPLIEKTQSSTRSAIFPGKLAAVEKLDRNDPVPKEDIVATKSIRQKGMDEMTNDRFSDFNTIELQHLTAERSYSENEPPTTTFRSVEDHRGDNGLPYTSRRKYKDGDAIIKLIEQIELQATYGPTVNSTQQLIHSSKNSKSAGSLVSQTHNPIYFHDNSDISSIETEKPGKQRRHSTSSSNMSDDGSALSIHLGMKPVRGDLISCRESIYSLDERAESICTDFDHQEHPAFRDVPSRKGKAVETTHSEASAAAANKTSESNAQTSPGSRRAQAYADALTPLVDYRNPDLSRSPTLEELNADLQNSLALLSKQETFESNSTKRLSGETYCTNDDTKRLLSQHGHTEVDVKTRTQKSVVLERSTYPNGRLLTGQRAKRHAPKELEIFGFTSKIGSHPSKETSKSTPQPDEVPKLPPQSGHAVVNKTKSIQKPALPKSSSPAVRDERPLTGPRAKRHAPKELDLSAIGSKLSLKKISSSKSKSNKSSTLCTLDGSSDTTDPTSLIDKNTSPKAEQSATSHVVRPQGSWEVVLDESFPYLSHDDMQLARKPVHASNAKTSPTRDQTTSQTTTQGCETVDGSFTLIDANSPNSNDSSPVLINLSNKASFGPSHHDVSVQGSPFKPRGYIEGIVWKSPFRAKGYALLDNSDNPDDFGAMVERKVSSLVKVFPRCAISH